MTIAKISLHCILKNAPTQKVGRRETWDAEDYWCKKKLRSYKPLAFSYVVTEPIKTSIDVMKKWKNQKISKWKNMELINNMELWIKNWIQNTRLPGVFCCLKEIFLIRFQYTWFIIDHFNPFLHRFGDFSSISLISFIFNWVVKLDLLGFYF